MDHRRRNQPRKGDRPRNVPPPEATGREERYFERRKAASTELVLQLLDGNTLRGVVEVWAGEMLMIQPADGPLRSVRKTDVRSVHEAE